jgi:uncharacterized protein YaaW (UPF0174 family)
MYRLCKLLDRASFEDRKTLAAILEASNAFPESICDALAKRSRSVYGRVFGPKPSYQQILQQVCTYVGLPSSRYDSEEDLENRIAESVPRQVWNAMSSTDQAELLRLIAAFGEANERVSGPAAVFVALTAAKLSGFGVYLLASTGLSAATAAVGVTLPFAAYTTMSSGIAVATGPIGWTAAGLYATHKLTAPSKPQLIRAILCIAGIRKKLKDSD